MIFQKMKKTEIHENPIDNCFALGGPCSAGCGPAPCATLCFSHFASKTKTQKNNEKNVFSRNDTDIEATLMTFVGSGRSLSGSSKFANRIFPEKCPKVKIRAVSFLPRFLAHFWVP